MGTRRYEIRTFGVLLGAALLLVTGTASADIDGFEVLSIEGDVTLSSRLGTSSNATDHMINIEDCEAYVGHRIEIEFGVDTTNYLNYEYGVAMSLPGLTCQTDAISFSTSNTESCKVVNQGELSTSFTEAFDLDWLTGGDCSDDSEATSVVYLVIVDSDAVSTAAEELYFRVDLHRPAIPEVDELVAGDERIEVLFNDTGNETEEDLTYTIYWSSEPISDPPGSGVSSDTTTSTSYEIEDDTLINGETYYVRVEAVDAFDNESGLSTELSTEPVATTDFWEGYKAAGGTDPGGFCFIATAAYGSPMGSELTTLRTFRDQVLWTTALGRAFVRGYYDWGRAPAAWIADKPALRTGARVALAPLVWVAGMTTTLGPLMTMLVLLLAAVLGALCLRGWRRRTVTVVEVTR